MNPWLYLPCHDEASKTGCPYCGVPADVGCIVYGADGLRRWSLAICHHSGRSQQRQREMQVGELLGAVLDAIFEWMTPHPVSKERKS